MTTDEVRAARIVLELAQRLLQVTPMTSSHGGPFVMIDGRQCEPEEVRKAPALVQQYLLDMGVEDMDVS